MARRHFVEVTDEEIGRFLKKMCIFQIITYVNILKQNYYVSSRPQQIIIIVLSFSPASRNIYESAIKLL